MRFATFASDRLKKAQAGIVTGERILPLRALDGFPGSISKLIRRGPDEWQRLHETLRNTQAGWIPMAEVTLFAPIRRARRNIMCLGWNYAAHADESAQATGRDVPLPEHPIVFTKAPSTINGPYDDFVYDASLTDRIDWEVELGVIIGVGGKAIAVERAHRHVFGYTVINDISARDLQRRHQQFFLGKSLDGACPMGPWIVTTDEISDPQDLALRTYVNGELKQNGHTSDQIFSVAETISILSRGMTLVPGDIIATGTPDGVGFARTPPEYLSDGDVVRCEIEGIGFIENRIVRAKGA